MTWKNIQKYKTDILLLTFLSVLMVVSFYPLTKLERHFEMYIVMRYLPDSLSELLKALFDRWPTGPEVNWVYRPLQLTILPYIYFKLFGWNHHYWLTVNLIFPCMILLFTYILVKIITRSRIAAFFSALFLLSYYINIFSYTVAIQYDPECLYIPLYLSVLILFVVNLKKYSNKITLWALFFFILALMSKEVAVTMPFMLISSIVLFKPKMVKNTYNRIKNIYGAEKSLKDYKNLFTNKHLLFGRLLPYMAIWIIYILFRVVYPLIKGNFDFTPSSANTLDLNLEVISKNIIHFLKGTSQIRNYLGTTGFSLIHIQNYFMFFLFLVVLIMIITQLISVNKVIIFSILLYFAQSLTFILINAPHSLHHLMPSIIGSAIIFGEVLRVCYYKIIRSSLGGKYSVQLALYGIMVLLTVILTVNGFVGGRKYYAGYPRYEYFTYVKNCTWNSIYDALPKPENRKSNTLFFIKNSDVYKGKGDNFYSVIKPAYYGKNNIEIIHEFSLSEQSPRLSRMNPKDYTIIVVEYIDEYKTINVTNESTMAEVHSYMYKKSPENGVWKTIALKGLTNLSFESWVVSASGELVPEQFSYTQSGDGGAVERCTSPDRVKQGVSSALVKPSSHGVSYIRHTIRDVSRIKGHWIRFSVWIKSANKTPGGVQTDIQDKLSIGQSISYQNSDDWELIEVDMKISSEAENVFLTCNVKYNSTAPAYFDHIQVKILTENSKF